MKVLRVACHPSQNAPRAENLHEPQLSLVVQEMLEKLLERQNSWWKEQTEFKTKFPLGQPEAFMNREIHETTILLVLDGPRRN